MNRLDEVLLEINGKISKSKNLYETSVGQLKDYLFDLNSTSDGSEENLEKMVSKLEIYKWFVAKEKAIYHAMNMLKLTRKTFIGYMWIPSEKEALVTQKLQNFSTTEFSKWRAQENGARPTPPTSFKTNDMLMFHQITVDTYKYATYGEINPALF